jgi:hypothetical protein
VRIILTAAWVSKQSDWMLTYADKVWTHRGWQLHQRTLHHFGQAFAFSGEGNHMQLPLEMYGHHCVVLTHEAAKAWIDLAEGRTHSKAGVQ